MLQSERRSSMPRSSVAGCAGNAITASNARDGSSSVRRGGSTPASPGSSISIQAGNHTGVVSCSSSASTATRHPVRNAQSGKFGASISLSTVRREQQLQRHVFAVLHHEPLDRGVYLRGVNVHPKWRRIRRERARGITVRSGNEVAT